MNVQIPAEVVRAAQRLRDDVYAAMDVLYGDYGGEADTAEDVRATEAVIAIDMRLVLDWITNASGLGAAEAAEPPTEPCDRTDLPEQSDMHCPCGFEAGEHLAWRRRYCRNRRFPEHGRRSPCVICGYLWEGAQSAEPPTDDVEAFLKRAHDQMLAHLDRVVDVDARLAEVKRRAMDGPGPGCPAHGLHPHDGMRCLDCPECVGPPEGIEALRPAFPEEAAYWTDDADGDPGGPFRSRES